MNVNDFAVASALLTLFAIGGTELVKQAFNRNWQAVVIISVCAIIGGLGGLFVLPVIGFAPGLAIGLSASGLITGVQKFGNGTTPLEGK